jgi:site-specific DNA-methyltransferase (adenine-specific)
VTTHRIIAGDCIESLSCLDSESVDLVVTDPPYNIGVDYGFGEDADRIDDYVEWCGRWIGWCYRALKPSGSMWVISGQEFGSWIDVKMQMAGLSIRNRVTWHETFGVYCRKKFGRCSRPIYYAVKNEKRFTFNAESVTIPSARQEKYGDRRANPGGKIMGDVWKVNRVCGTFKERVKGVPTQLPEELVERIIRVSSNDGDVILDPFAGSGTTLAVAARLGRSGIGCELNPEYIVLAEKRIAEAREKAGLFA